MTATLSARSRQLGTAVMTAVAWLVASSVSAYSSFPDYVRPIQDGGGGGKFFTGSPADAHGCDVCHRGGPSAPLTILGLPEDGYVPGQTYEILFQWPATTPHVALMAEFTDAAGAPAGVTALAPFATWSLGERCESGDPAADICRVGGAGSACCRELGMTRDACSFPGERSVFWVLDCGSKSARAVWTAPAAGAGDVWFSSSMIASDIMNDARGDGASAVRTRLRVAGSSPAITAATGTCQIAAGGATAAFRWCWLLLLVAFAARRRRFSAR